MLAAPAASSARASRATPICCATHSICTSGRIPVAWFTPIAASPRVADGKTMIRRGDEPLLQELDGPTQALAPQGDLMAYMAAVRDVTSHGSETRAGLTFTRYSFTIDGPTFAGYMRDQLRRPCAARASCRSKAHLDVPAYYAQMTGDGELWVRTDGLPLRQILDLRFPEQAGERTSAHIKRDLRFRAGRRGLATWPYSCGRLTGWAANLASLALYVYSPGAGADPLLRLAAPEPCPGHIHDRLARPAPRC